MNLPYFYESFILTPQHTLSEETSKHCVQVLRMKKNDTLNLTNGKGSLYTATIVNPDKKHCEVRTEKKQNANTKSQKIFIAISVLKNPARLEWFMEKATEIGVHAIVPLICGHTEKGNLRYERMNGILIAAMLQSKQTWLPELYQPKKFNDYIKQDFNGVKLIAHCGEQEKISLTNFKTELPALILIGPEGDFSNSEIESAIQHNFIPVSLGSTRLRTETAGIVAATLLCNL